MIELEIQILSEKREGLLVEIGRSVLASGFILQRQRLTQDRHGVLLTMVVRGRTRKRRTLEAVLYAHERVMSFNIATFVDGALKPHFAASPATARQTAVSLPMAAIEVLTAVAPAATAEEQHPAATCPVSTGPGHRHEPELEFIFTSLPPPPPAPAPMPVTPFVELIPIGPDIQAVEKIMPALTGEYPQIYARLMMLEHVVAEAARESSLLLAGQRTGKWLFERDYAPSDRRGLPEAIKSIGIPALNALVEVEHQGDQLHIRNSPLCTKDGHSGCKFFSGFLQGLLGCAMLSDNLSLFTACCRSCGADECVLVVSD